MCYGMTLSINSLLKMCKGRENVLIANMRKKENKLKTISYISKMGEEYIMKLQT